MWVNLKATALTMTELTCLPQTSADAKLCVSALV